MKRGIFVEVCETILIGLALALLFCQDAALPETPASVNKSAPKVKPASAVQRIAGRGSYAVLVSSATYGDPEWKKVVEALRKEHDASVIVYAKSIAQTRSVLREVFPRYACFVARPEEAGRDFVVSVHRMTRTLDDDPYTDVLWGILTGYDAKDALRVAQHREPLIVRRAAAGTGINLGVFDEGRWFSEGEKGAMWEKRVGGKTEKKKCPDDSTKAIVDTLNDFKPDLFMTSGHASMRDWQIGYSYKNGQFRCKDGRLFGLDLKGKTYPINSPNPKVYLPLGNCLIGLIPDRNCMALAYVHTGGVYQMVGYVVSTWYGYGGWGVSTLFIGQPGRYTLAEAFYLNNQALIHQLETRFPKSARIDFDNFDIERDRRSVGEMFREHKLQNKDERGLLWDRDTVAFYGDPAWEARLARRPLAWEQQLTAKDGAYTFEIAANRDAGWGRPPMIIFPHRIEAIEIVEGKELSPVITDNFLLLPNPKKFEKGKRYRVVFKAKTISDDPKTVNLLPVKYRYDVIKALTKAKDNRSELVAAVRSVRPEHREAVAFLIANMPERDLTTLSKDYIIENIELAYKARSEVAWGKEIPDEIFLGDVLPYASVNERRDNWRRDFYQKFMPTTKQCKTAEEAVLRLNKEVFRTLGVKYHATKRPKPNQSPYESVEAGFASCTGLSILLIDACRAAGVPARMAGTPRWVSHRGNHSWVEVWHHQWRFVGAAEPGPLDKAWFFDRAKQADPNEPRHRIYASSFARTDVCFPLVWNPRVKYVWADDVTKFYTARREVKFRILDKAGGKPIKAELTLRLNGRVVARDVVNDAAKFDLAGGQTYSAKIRPLDGSAALKKQIAVSEEDDQLTVIAVRD